MIMVSLFLGRDADERREKCLKFEMPKVPKIIYNIFCLYLFVIGVICEICG